MFGKRKHANSDNAGLVHNCSRNFNNFVIIVIFLHNTLISKTRKTVMTKQLQTSYFM